MKIEAIIYSLIKTSEEFEAVQGDTKGGEKKRREYREKKMAKGRTDEQQEKIRHSKI